jgi:hypothetical protein
MVFDMWLECATVGYQTFDKTSDDFKMDIWGQDWYKQEGNNARRKQCGTQKGDCLYTSLFKTFYGEHHHEFNPHDMRVTFGVLIQCL